MILINVRWNDVCYALRLMRRSPGFTAAAVLLLALGIGANTAIFSLFNTLMLRTLAVSHPGQLVEFLETYPGEPRGGYWSWASYEHFRASARTLAAMTGASFEPSASVRGDGIEPENVCRESIAGNYFQVLGLKPAIGRLIVPDDAPPEGPGNLAVASWAFWDSRFHRDPAMIGKRIFVDGTPMTIIGVAPRAYTGVAAGIRTDIWTPRGNANGLAMIGRLKPGATIAQARAEAAVLFRFTIEERFAARNDPLARQLKVEVEPAGAGLWMARDRFGKPVTLLLCVVGLLLLLACINMASMLLARLAVRQREIGVRMSLGASRARLAAQMLTESVLLSGAGALAGIVLAYFGAGALARILASGRAFERIELQVAPDVHLLLFTVGIAVLTGVLFGLAPAWQAFRSAPASALRPTGGGAGTPFWRVFGKALVAAQVALSVLLVTASVFFLSDLARLRHFDLGFRSDHVLLMTADPARAGFRREQLAAPYEELLARLEAIPGVRSASIAGCTPIQGCGASRFVNAEGYIERPEDRRWTALSWVAPGYFKTLGIPLLAGRDFSFQDAGRSRVAIVSESTTRHYFPGANPIGRHIAIGRDPRDGGWYGSDEPYEIIGVVGDAKASELREPAPRTMYLNMFQEGQMGNQFVLRTSVDPELVARAARLAVGDVLKNAEVTRVTTLSAQVDAAIVPERLIATLSTYFGGLGAALAAIGFYGLLAYTVARRTNEIGVRMALGATAGAAGRLVLREALGVICAGLLGGAAAALWISPSIAKLIPNFETPGVAPLAWGAGAMVAVGLVASYIPARRAARVDPMVALRHE